MFLFVNIEDFDKKMTKVSISSPQITHQHSE